MASDITLAVGDGARHMTYDELAQGRGILLASAPFVPRATSRNSAETPDFGDAGPAEAASYGTTPTPVANGFETDPLTAIGIQTLSQAVEMLREDVEHVRDRADRAERQVEVERQLVEQAHKRVDGLLIELAEGRIAANDQRLRGRGIAYPARDAERTPPVVATVAPMTLSARYRDVLLALIALVQCYATRTQDGCAPLSYHVTMAECQVQSEDYRRFDTRAINATGLPVVVSYRCVATDR